MALIQMRNVADNWLTTLASAINNSTTTIVVATGGGAGAPDVPFYFNIDSELIECTARSTDSLTVVRGVGGTSASSHDAATAVEQNIYAIQFTESKNKIAVLETLVSKMMGDDNGVQKTDADNDCLVEESDTPGMSVKINPGAGAIDGQPFAVIDVAALTGIVAPVTDPRIDVVSVNQAGTLAVVTGTEAGSPSAPAVPSGSIGLATIALTTSTTSILDAIITDVRDFI